MCDVRLRLLILWNFSNWVKKLSNILRSKLVLSRQQKFSEFSLKSSITRAIHGLLLTARSRFNSKLFVNLSKWFCVWHRDLQRVMKLLSISEIILQKQLTHFYLSVWEGIHVKNCTNFPRSSRWSLHEKQQFRKKGSKKISYFRDFRNIIFSVKQELKKISYFCNFQYFS